MGQIAKPCGRSSKKKEPPADRPTFTRLPAAFHELPVNLGRGTVNLGHGTAARGFEDTK